MGKEEVWIWQTYI